MACALPVQRAALSQEHVQQFFVERARIRLVAHGQIEPRFLVDNRFDVRKRLEPALAVVAAHAAFAHAAERHLARCQVDARRR